MNVEQYREGTPALARTIDVQAKTLSGVAAEGDVTDPLHFRVAHGYGQQDPAPARPIEVDTGR